MQILTGREAGKQSQVTKIDKERSSVVLDRLNLVRGQKGSAAAAGGPRAGPCCWAGFLPGPLRALREQGAAWVQRTSLPQGYHYADSAKEGRVMFAREKPLPLEDVALVDPTDR